MERSFKNYELKLTKILQKFLIPDYKIENDTYLEILLSQISGKYDADLRKRLMQLPIFIDWLDEAISLWDQPIKSLPSIAIQSFTINLTSIISNEEFEFVKLELMNIYTRLCNLFSVDHPHTNVSIKLAYIRLLTTMLNHDSGIKWIFQTERWRHILAMSLKSNTIYINRESQQFFLKLFLNCLDSYPTSCNSVWNDILMPLQNFNNHVMNITFQVKDTEMQDILTPMLNLVFYVLDAIYNSKNRKNQQSIAKLMLSINDFETNIFNLINGTHDKNFHILLTQVLVQVYVSELHLLDNILLDNYREFYLKLCKLFSILIEKRSTSAFLRGTRLCHIYWKQILNEELNEVLQESNIIFENQMIIFQIMPILNVIHIIDPKWVKKSNEFLDNYIGKLFKISCEHTIRLAYNLRFTLDADLNHNFRYAIESVRLLMESRKYIDRERVVIAFRSLIYVFQDICSLLHEKTLPLDILTAYNGVVAYLLDAIATLITEFKITWRESVETICILTLSVQLLNSPNICNRIAILTFKLLHLAIENFMAPNLALLMDTMEGSSSMLSLGPLLYGRLHDNNWEIRDSALEVVHTIIVISEYKYPVFQKLIIENNFGQLIINMVVNDVESFVRATALKCITAMIKVDTFWPTILQNENLLDKAINIIYNETEGIVRREAVNLMCQLHENERIPSEIIPKIYSTMSTAAIADFHWEVKVNALKFWKQVICKELTNQGMIDGSFPEFTFSRQSRKIVALTNTEITDRLNKTIEFLANVDCLTVLLLSLHDDCDITVVENAVSIVVKLQDILMKYNIIDNKHKENSKSSSSALKSPTSNDKKDHISSEKTEWNHCNNLAKSDETIELIVNSDDISLLANVYRNQMTIDSSINDDQMNVDSAAGVKKVSAYDFLIFLSNKNPLTILEERNNWLKFCSNNLESLLDDMLKTYEDCDINKLDCY